MRRSIAVAAAVEPEAAAFLVLDLEIIADRVGLAAALPPFAMDPLGAVGARDPVDPAAPDEAARRQIGKLGHDILDPLGRRQQADRARPRRPGRRLGERPEAADASFGHVAFDRAEPVNRRRSPRRAASRSTSGREVGRGLVAGQRVSTGCGPSGSTAAGDEAHRLDAEARLDRLDLRHEEAEQMGAVAGRAGGADGDHLLHLRRPGGRSG